MDGYLLRFYVHESKRQGNRLLWEWLLELANNMGIRGGSAFRAMAGFGRHHVLREDHFFELAGNLAVEVEFVVTADESARILDLVRESGARIFYARTPIEFGVVNPAPDDEA